MHPRQQALLGAAFGALAVLLLHPDTRPYYSSGLWSFGQSSVIARSSYLPENGLKVPDPVTSKDAAYWMVLAADLRSRSKPISTKDLRKLVTIAEVYGRREPDNAFWPQMESVWRWHLGEKKASVAAWLRASRCISWKSYEPDRDETLAGELRREAGNPLAWHEAFVLLRRTDVVYRAIYVQSRQIWALGRLSTRDGLALRCSIVYNAYLLAGCGTVAGTMVAIDMMELASRPQNLRPETTPKKLTIARFALVNNLRDAGMVDDSTRVAADYRESDGWRALYEPDRAHDTIRDGSWTALACASIPGAMVGLSILGLALLWVGGRIERSAKLQKLFGPTIAPAFGAVLAIGAYALTRLPLLSFWAALSFGFFAYTPSHVRSAEPGYLGPLFRFTLGVLVIAFCVVLALFLVGLGPSGYHLMPLLGVEREYGTGSTLLLSLAAILLGLILSMAPAWGIVQKFRPSQLVGLALREAGIGIFATCLALGVIAGPLAYQFDMANYKILTQLRNSETGYYYQHQ